MSAVKGSGLGERAEFERFVADSTVSLLRTDWLRRRPWREASWADPPDRSTVVARGPSDGGIAHG